MDNTKNNINWKSYTSTEEYSNEVKEVVLGHTCDNIISDRLYDLFKELADELREPMKKKHGQGFEDALDEEDLVQEHTEDAIADAFIAWLRKYNYIREN